MGGCGSGRHNGVRKRRVESCIALDVRELARMGALALGAAGTLTWQRDCDAVASVGFRVDTTGLVLSYDAYDGEAQRAIEQGVALSSVPAALGGARACFLCPGAECGRRVAVLYFVRGAFYCRHCHRLAYASQCEDVMWRARRRVDKLRARLGIERQNPFALANAARPKGMWRTTFSRLHASALEAYDIASIAQGLYFARLLAKINRRL